MLYRVAAGRPRAARVIAAMVLAGCIAVLGLSAWLEPDPTGLGTHRQLGYPTCTFVVLFGLPCPTCGMTTAFAHTVRGQLAQAFLAHPAGLVYALGTIAAAAVSLSVLITGKILAVNWQRVSPAWVAVSVLVILILGWLFKLAFGLITGKLPLAGLAVPH